jgi:transcriptional regulator with XRE-family HTH domain
MPRSSGHTAPRESPMARRGFSKSFGVVLRAARLRADLSQEALAEQAGVHRNYVGMVERGENSVTLDVAFHLADSLGVPLDQMVREATKHHGRDARAPRKSTARPAAKPAR